MPDPNVRAIGELINLPIGDLIRSVALGIAEAQFQLDKASMTVAELMSGQRLLRDLDTGRLIGADGQPSEQPMVIDSRVYFGYHYDQDGTRVPDRVSLLELGFTPTFYQFVDTTIEIKLAVKMTRSERSGPAAAGGAGAGEATRTGAAGWWSGSANEQFVLNSTPVDAGYAAAYNFQAELASVVKTKLVPIPPPTVLEERIQALMEARRLDEEESRKARALPSPRGQVTDVDISVADTTSRELELSIKTDGKPVTGRKLTVRTIPGHAADTAVQLAALLNTELPEILLAEARGDTTVIQFRDERTYEVAQVQKQRGKNNFTIHEIRQANPADA